MSGCFPDVGLPGVLRSALESFAAGRAALAAGCRVEPLGGGRPNRSWRVRGEALGSAVDWAVRLGGSSDRGLGVDRAREIAAHACAAEAGLAPRIVHAAHADGWLVTEWCDGGTWTANEAREPHALRRLALTLAALHALPPPPIVAAAAADTTLAATFARLLAQPARAPGPIAREPLRTLAESVLAGWQHGPQALCHRDLHRGNVLVRAAALVFVDWEYAAFADVALEYAAWASYHDLGADERRTLLDAANAGVDAAQFESACLAFDCVRALWYDAAGAWGTLGAGARNGLVERLSR